MDFFTGIGNDYKGLAVIPTIVQNEKEQRTYDTGSFEENLKQKEKMINLEMRKERNKFSCKEEEQRFLASRDL